MGRAPQSLRGLIHIITLCPLVTMDTHNILTPSQHPKRLDPSQVSSKSSSRRPGAGEGPGDRSFLKFGSCVRFLLSENLQTRAGWSPLDPGRSGRAMVNTCLVPSSDVALAPGAFNTSTVTP